MKGKIESSCSLEFIISLVINLMNSFNNLPSNFTWVKLCFHSIKMPGLKYSAVLLIATFPPHLSQVISVNYSCNNGQLLLKQV